MVPSGSKMEDNADSCSSTAVTAGFVAGGFQLKGTSKRKIITTSDDKSDYREAVLGIESGVIKSSSTLQSDRVHLIIPLPPGRVDIVRAKISGGNDSLQPPVSPIDRQNTVIPGIECKFSMEFSLPPAILATNSSLADCSTKTLEQLATEELIAEIAGGKENSIDNLHSIPLVGGNKSVPLLAACLAPELIGLKDDDERFKADIHTRPDDLNVRSDAYKVVRIEDFGAAMLRGMGWAGEIEEKKEEEKIIPRDNRLGLGAFSTKMFGKVLAL